MLPLARPLLILIPLLATLFCSAEDKRPNILFALADDWGWPHAGIYGDPLVQTPTFDRIASEGALFEHAYISSPSCTPSRNAIITGQQFYRLQAGANLWSTLDREHPNFMYLLQENGYAIAHWRKAWGPGDYTIGGYEEHPCGSNLEFETFMEDRDSEKPFCFWFGTSDPHRKYDTGSGERSGMDLSKVHIPAFYPDTQEIRSDIADYYWEVQRWDRDLADALKLIEEAGELENTIIVVTGDHGMPFPRCKGNLYDWGSRVPLAIRWGKQIPASQHVSDFVSLTDLAPTFLQAAGITVPESMTGQSLLPLANATPTSQPQTRDYVVFGRERHTPAQAMPSMAGYPSRAIRTEKWLFIQNYQTTLWPAGVPSGSTHPYGSFADCDAGPTKTLLMKAAEDPQLEKYYQLSFGQRPAYELYDSHADPYQIDNLADRPEHAETLAKLKAQLEAYLAQTGDPRHSDAPILFDTYEYQGKYLAPYLKKQGP